MNLEFGVALLKEKLQQEKITITADRIQEMSHSLPAILKTIYMEDKARVEEQSYDEMTHLKQHE